MSGHGIVMGEEVKGRFDHGRQKTKREGRKESQVKWEATKGKVGSAASKKKGGWVGVRTYHLRMNQHLGDLQEIGYDFL